MHSTYKGVRGLGAGTRPLARKAPKRIVRASQSSSNGTGSNNGTGYTGAPMGRPGGRARTSTVDPPVDLATEDAKEALEAALKAGPASKGVSGVPLDVSPIVENTGRNGTPVSSTNGNGSTYPQVPGDMDPCEAGQLEACANIKFAENERRLATAAAIGESTDPVTAAAVAETVTAAAPAKVSDDDRGTPYAQAGFSSWQRTFQIYSFALTFAWRYSKLNKAGTYKKMPGGMSPENVSAKKTELAKWLREGLIRLGPTFIKIGQQFSTRVDVLSKEFIQELEQLQDNVPAFGSAAVRDAIHRSFGKPIDEIFDTFDLEPIAAASLGQVHLATLKGKKVVVKVQRPGLRELFAVDLKNVRVIAQWLQRLDPKTDGAARDWVAIYDECSRILYEEIDYKVEAAYAQEFAKNFEEMDWVKVPEVYTDYLSSEVLVMEYVPGVKINNGEAIDQMGLDRDRLARLAVESYLQQLLRHGLFHADPHPGNVAVDAQNNGRLIYYDFGMMGRIQPQIRAGLRELFYGVYNKDPDQCLVALEQMGVLVPGGDRTSIRRTADFFLSSFADRLKEQREEREKKGAAYDEQYKAQRTKDESKERRKAILSNIGEDLLIASADKPFRFPAEFTFVVRSFTVLDGIGKSLSKRFDISEISAPYARELVFDGKSPADAVKEQFAKGWKRQDRAVKGLFDGPIRIQEIQQSLKRLEQGEFKPRVRALEVERAVQRMGISQNVLLSLIAASMCVNVGTVLSVSALPTMASCSFIAAGLFGVMTLINIFKLRKMEKKELQLMGQA